MVPIVEIHGLKKFYGERLVLDIPELPLEKGVRYAVIGPNGSGKTTLLRILAGIITPDEGSIELKTCSVGYMPQHPYAFGFSVRRNVELAIKDRKVSRAGALAALDKVGLYELAEQKGDRLSGGETQRMAFARIIAEPHELVLMDEPTASADIEGSVKMEEALNSYILGTGCTLLFTTHMPSQAAIVAQKVILMESGRIEELGDMKQVLYNPRSESARLFLSHWRLA